MTELESKCVDPGAIQDWELEAYADGDVSPHVVEHLSRCPACRAWLAEALSLEGRLRQALYRFDCPSPDTLRDYYWGYLAAEQQRQVEHHLDRCPHCTAELAELTEFVTAERTESSDALLSRARQAAAQLRLVVARIVSPARRPVLDLRGDPALALRSETRDVLLFSAGDTALSVNLEQETTGAYTLFGQVLSPPAALSPGDRVRLTAYRGTKEPQEIATPVQVLLNANGGFALPNLRSGVYQLVVCLSDRRIVVPTLRLKAGS